jgi:hypothetical protein
VTTLCFIDCATCGVSFKPVRKERRFCSNSCAAKWRSRGERNANWRGGKTAHPLYETYLDMIARCSRPTHHAWARYGGRGISVCDRWRENFWAFVADMGARPAGRSLDRVDNDGPYSPKNCRWATASQQMKNRRATAYAGLAHNPTTGRWEAA